MFSANEHSPPLNSDSQVSHSSLRAADWYAQALLRVRACNLDSYLYNRAEKPQQFPTGVQFFLRPFVVAFRVS